MPSNTNIVKSLKDVQHAIGTSHTELREVSHQLFHISGQVLPELLNKMREGQLQLANQIEVLEAVEDEASKCSRLRNEITSATEALCLDRTKSLGSEAIGYHFAMDLILPALNSDHLETLLANIKEVGKE